MPNPMLTAAEARYPTVKWMGLVVCGNNRYIYRVGFVFQIIYKLLTKISAIQQGNADHTRTELGLIMQ